MKPILILLSTVMILATPAVADVADELYYPEHRAFFNNPDYFPIAVWLQDPALAEQYQEAGINLYVGLHRGPTEEQLAALESVGMHVVCHQNDVGLAHLNDPLIVAWMHGDEPDNAQADGSGGYGPPIDPSIIVGGYNEMRENDTSRPILINLGQSVAWNGYVGRGVGRNQPQDYPRYMQGGDIISFDIYPVTSRYEQIKGNLEYVAHGVTRLRVWSDYQKPVWNCIETAHINSDTRPTPEQVRSEVWMSIIHGSRGLIYFVHEWQPEFNAHALLDYPDVLAMVTEVNHRITELAPVLNSPTIPFGAEAHPDNPAADIAVMMKLHGGKVYVFAANMDDTATAASFLVSRLPGQATATVLGEERTIDVPAGEFDDEFEPYGVHLYVIE